MDVELLIDGEEASALGEELALLTGKSVTEAVMIVLRAGVERERTVQEKSRQILAGAAELRKHFKEPLGTSDHSFLYGEDGLPI